MKYFIAQPLAVEHVPADMLEQIIARHGSYETFNECLAAACNLPEQITAFEQCLVQEELDWLSKFNVTLYSGQKQQEAVSGVSLYLEPREVGAVASKSHGIPYISIDVDMLVMNPKGWTTEQLRGYLVQVLIHETTHLHQMIRGDLDITPTLTVWKGVEYSNAELAAEVAVIREMHPDATDFQFHLVDQQVQYPWELEAYGRTLEAVDIDLAYPDPQMNSLMHRIQNDFRKIYMSNAVK